MLRQLSRRCTRVLNNEKIRRHAKERGVFLWELAARVGFTDSTFSRKLRMEFSEEDTEKMLNLIDEIAGGREK